MACINHWMGKWQDSGRYLISKLCSERKELQPEQGEPRDWWSGRNWKKVWWKWYLTPCRASRSVESFALRSCSSCSCLLSVRSSCWASTLMSLATTTAVWRSAWNRRHSSFSSYRHSHIVYCTGQCRYEHIQENTYRQKSDLGTVCEPSEFSWTEKLNDPKLM